MDRQGGAGGAERRRSSRFGIGEALPSVRVRITVWLTSGRVSSALSAAAAAAKAGTPGVTS